jgi:hypothetical protein
MPGIAPDTPPPHPTVGPWFYLILNFQNTTGAGSAQGFLPFIPSDEPVIGSNPTTYLTDLIFPFIGPLQAWWPVTGLLVEIGFYWQTLRGVQRWRVGAGGLPLAQGLRVVEQLPSTLNGLIQKGHAGSIKHVGRFWVPYICEDFVGERDVLTTAGFSALNNIATQVALTQTSNGITFTPALYSPSTNSLRPLTFFRSSQRAFNLMRRSPHRSKAPVNIAISTFEWDY